MPGGPSEELATRRGAEATATRLELRARAQATEDGLDRLRVERCRGSYRQLPLAARAAVVHFGLYRWWALRAEIGQLRDLVLELRELRAEIGQLERVCSRTHHGRRWEQQRWEQQQQRSRSTRRSSRGPRVAYRYRVRRRHGRSKTHAPADSGGGGCSTEGTARRGQLPLAPASAEHRAALDERRVEHQPPLRLEAKRECAGHHAPY